MSAFRGKGRSNLSHKQSHKARHNGLFDNGRSFYFIINFSVIEHAISEYRAK